MISDHVDLRQLVVHAIARLARLAPATVLPFRRDASAGVEIVHPSTNQREA